ncbi:MAG: HAD family phosphatase [Phycisphaerae bacterium]
MLKAVIFDFDGVISDSEPCHLAATNKVLADFGIQLSKEEYYSEYLGFTDCEMFEAIKERYKTDYNEIPIKQLIERKGMFFEEVIRQTDHLFDGIPELIKKIKSSGINVGIYSGALSGDIELMLKDSGLGDCFDIIITADDVEKGKPDPEGYLLALEELNTISKTPITAKECVVIEDSHWGIVAAKKAGMKVAAVTNSYPAEELGNADVIVDSVEQLNISDLQKLCSD